MGVVTRRLWSRKTYLIIRLNTAWRHGKPAYELIVKDDLFLFIAFSRSFPQIYFWRLNPETGD